MAKTAPKSLDLIIDTPDFYDFADIDKVLRVTSMSVSEMINLDEEQIQEKSANGLGRVYF